MIYFAENDEPSAIREGGAIARGRNCVVKRDVKTFPVGAGVLSFGCSSPGVVVGFPDTTLSVSLTFDPQRQIELSNPSILGLT